MRVFSDSFALAPEPQALVAALVASCDEFSHLTDARIVCIASQPTPVLRGAACKAFIASPSVQVSPLKPLFAFLLAQLVSPLLDWEMPDYILVVDAALWPTLDAEHQERLVYHELCHVIARVDEDTGLERRSPEDGRILTKLQPHEYEFFDEEVRRYGPAVCELDRAAVAIADGHRAAQRRRLRIA